MSKTIRVLSLIALACFGSACSQRAWIIDTHTHFKGPDQIAYESEQTERHPKNTLGWIVRAEDYRPVADRMAIQSTVIVEAVDQDQPQFNDWVFEACKSELVCGYIARGDLTSQAFDEKYERYSKTGYLKGYRFRFDELRGYLENDLARDRLKTLERDGMVVDLLIEVEHADDVLELAKAYPDLTIVINHCFRAKMDDGKMSDEWHRAVTECAKHPNVYCKISSIVNFVRTEPFEETSPTDVATYLPVMEPCFQAFGEDRMIFGTNWGVCTHFAPVDDVTRIVRTFLASKGDSALRKGMRDNAIRVYRIDSKHLR